jgi:nascent polypeptide-associated complex subunit alpha
MFPNMNGLDPRRVNSMMKQMGINNEEISAIKVTIETEDGILIINDPSVTKITMQGQSSFQISGTVEKEDKEKTIPLDDIKMVSEAANISEEKSKELLTQTDGDIAQAIEKATSE